MTRKMAYIGTSYFIGLFFASFISFKFSLLIGIISASFGFFSLVLKNKNKNKIAVCSFAFAFSMIWYSLFGLIIYNNIISVDGEHIELTGVIAEHSDYSGDDSSYIIRTRINGHNTRVILFAETKYSVGDKIYVSGIPYIPENTYVFPKKDYYMSNGIFLCVKAEQVEKITHYNSPSYIAEKVRNYISTQIGALLPGIEGNLMNALLFGDKSGLNIEVLSGFSQSGIRHIISVSGFHLSVVCGLIFIILKHFKAGKISGFLISELFIFIFSALAGFSFSVVRSGIMMTILLFGDLIKRRQDIYSSLSTAFIILTITMPFSVRNTSLLLSVMGVFGIGIVAPYFVRGKNFGKYLDKPLKIMIYAAVCTLTTFPFTLLTFREISLISPIGNLIIVPLCSIVLILGIIVVFTAWLPLISSPIIILCGMICKLILFLSEKLSELPFSSVSLGYESLVIISFILFASVVISYFVFNDRKFTVFVTVLSVILMAFSYVINDFALRDCLKITIFGGNYSSIVIQKSDNTVIISGNGKNQVDAVYKYLSNNGLKNIDALILTTSPQYFSSSYDSVLYDVSCETVYISDKSGFPKDVRILGCSPNVYGYNNIVIDYNDIKINICNENVCIFYNDFSFLYAVNSSFEDESYSAVAFKKQPSSVRGGYMIDCSDDIGYTVICDGEKVKVVNI